MIIRINLHPAKKVKTKANPATGVLVVCVAIAIVIVASFFYLTQQVDSETSKVKREISSIQSQITEYQGQIQEISEIRRQLDDMTQRSQKLAMLTSNRQGPQYVLNELARLMSNPSDSAYRKIASDQKWMIAWEPNNIYLTSFIDQTNADGNGVVVIRGIARQMDDIDQLWLRMKTSTIFRNIRLSLIKDANGVGVTTAQEFEFTAEANFNYRTKNGLGLLNKLEKDANSSEENQQADAPKQD